MVDKTNSGTKHPGGLKSLSGSEHPPVKNAKAIGPVDAREIVNVTLIVRRRPGSALPYDLTHFQANPISKRKRISHTEFADRYGADMNELESVADYARSHGLKVEGSHQARRSVEVSGTAAQVSDAFGVTLQYFQSPRGKYRGFDGPIQLPPAVAEAVEAVIGLDNRTVPARRGPVRRGPKQPGPAGFDAAASNSADPPETNPLSPLQVADLYNFPASTGSGQTIGIYEMVVTDPQTGAPQNPGYAASDLSATFNAFGGSLSVPTPVDIPVDGQQNAGISDVETVLDICVAGAIAQQAKIAVYFTGGEVRNIVHALQRMIHPNTGDPVPTVISISYGWGPDDEDDGATPTEMGQMNQLFQDAANQLITVLVSSGDSGALIESRNQAQASYPATDPFVLACGGTTIGSISGPNFVEYIWNDSFGGEKGATGGGVSVRFNQIPNYQAGFPIPKRINTGTIGRGIPDIAGNASPNSGYAEFIGGQSQGPVGGTSAVAPLYAGLIARLNATLGTPVGFINPLLYSLAKTAFRFVGSNPGATNNSFGGVTGYPAGPDWNACTGLGSVIGTKLLQAMQSAPATPAAQATPLKHGHAQGLSEVKDVPSASETLGKQV